MYLLCQTSNAFSLMQNVPNTIPNGGKPPAPSNGGGSAPTELIWFTFNGGHSQVCLKGFNFKGSRRC